MEKLIKFLKEEDGVTAIEYGLIAALISVAILAILGKYKHRPAERLPGYFLMPLPQFCSYMVAHTWAK